jgi:hypothetical protein
MMEAIEIIEVVRMGNSVLVTFSDGRVATLTAEEIHPSGVLPPPEPDRSVI